MDLMNLLRADGEATMEVETLAGEVILQEKGDPNPGKPVTITFSGVDSPEWKDKVRELNQRATRKGDNVVLQTENERVELFAAVTKRWDGVSIDGKPTACNIDTARLLYRGAPDLLRQANRFIGKLENFNKASPKPS